MTKLWMASVLSVALFAATATASTSTGQAAGPSFTGTPTFKVRMPRNNDPRDCGKGDVLLTLWTTQRLRTLEVRVGRGNRYAALSKLTLKPEYRNGTLKNGYTLSLTCHQTRQANLVVGRHYRVIARASNRTGQARLNTVVRLRRA